MIKSHAVPNGSVLGLNYSGAHDTAIAIVAPDGRPIFALSLERLTRVKQDGRTPELLLEFVPWDKIARVAVSTFKHAVPNTCSGSKYLDVALPTPRSESLAHGSEFLRIVNGIGRDIEFVGHQHCHANIAFWGSGFNEALCITYDGGMYNDPWFGGVFQCNRTDGIIPVDLFDSRCFAKITSLYSFVTALLHFVPNRHEGKLTGLAAFGKPHTNINEILDNLFTKHYFEMESCMRWLSLYENVLTPHLYADNASLNVFRVMLTGYKREDIAASLQRYAEMHISNILEKVIVDYGADFDICLSGGLFSNVRINQLVSGYNFNNVFVSPPMTDDGTALGAALCLLSKTSNFAPPRTFNPYLGPSYSSSEVCESLISRGVRFSDYPDPAQEVARILSLGYPVAVFQGAAEFGPRALGNRSILAPANDSTITSKLNAILRRSEFMPFAPVTLGCDAQNSYCYPDSLSPCLRYMTTSVSCSDSMKSESPAVVHLDGTARPQLVFEKDNKFLYDILVAYEGITSFSTLINTSFNVHEKPIVCSPDDALDDFFESGLKYMFIQGAGLITSEGNEAPELSFLRKRLSAPDLKLSQLHNVVTTLSDDVQLLSIANENKENEIQRLSSHISSFNTEPNISDLLSLCEKNKIVIKELQMEVHALNVEKQQHELYVSKLARMFKRLKFLLKYIVRPKIGVLSQHPPIPMQLHASYTTPVLPQKFPKVSIVTPSFQQAEYIGLTVDSILGQQYPNLEYFIQDGGSQDGTVEIVKRYTDRLSGWESLPDNGQAHAINLGFNKTSGEIMAWVNSDDLLLPGALAFVVEYFNNHPDVDVIYGNRIIVDVDGNQIGRWVLPPHDDGVLFWADYIPQETMFWRRRIWDKVGAAVDESFQFAMDWDLILRFQAAGARFKHLPRYLGAFRVHELQKTTAAINDVGFGEMMRLRERCHKRIVTQVEICKGVAPYLIKHRIADFVGQLQEKLWGGH